MVTYVNPLSGQTIQPSEVGYAAYTFSADTSLQWPVNGNTEDVVAYIMDVTTTVSDISIYMPPANQVSTGQDSLIRNVGANTFYVLDYDGNTIATITSGQVKYVYITDNTTPAGNWAVFTFGTGTSAADAATLAGYGLKAIASTLNQGYQTTTYYSNYAIQASDRAKFLLWGSGVGTFTLPSASSVGNNWFCMVRNAGSGILTITPSGTDTIDGDSNAQLQLSESFVLVSDGSNWYSFGYGQSVQFAFTQLALAVTGGTLTLSPSQASNLIQEYTGTLTSNQIIVLPSTVQLYAITNNTTGAFTLTFKTVAVGGATIACPQGTSIIVVCDGTNVYNAASGSSTSLPTLTLGNGSAANPSLRFSGDLTTGLFLGATGQLDVAVGGTAVGYFSSAGLTTTLTLVSGGTF
jgi:hypothetical protein